MQQPFEIFSICTSTATYPWKGSSIGIQRNIKAHFSTLALQSDPKNLVENNGKKATRTDRCGAKGQFWRFQGEQE